MIRHYEDRYQEYKEKINDYSGRRTNEILSL